MNSFPRIEGKEFNYREKAPEPGKLLTPGNPASPQKQVKAPSTIKSEPVVNELVSPAR